MSGYPKHNPGNPGNQIEDPQPPQSDDVIGILKRVQQQLVYLEKKLDALLAQRPSSQDRPPFQKHFSRPFRPNRPGHFNRPQGESSHGGNFAHKKKPFYKRPER